MKNTDNRRDNPSIRGTAPAVQEAARLARRAMTPAENALWQELRGKKLDGIGFRRQHPVGRFILDFYAPLLHLAVEVDGSIHDTQAEYDAERTAILETYGCHVLRVRNEEVLHAMPAVLTRLRSAASEARQPSPKNREGLQEDTLSPPPLVLGGGGRGVGAILRGVGATLLIDDNSAVRTLTLNRPEVHNAFDETLIAELTAAFHDAAQDENVRVVVLTGAGASFCAGADLAWMGRMAGYSHAENVADAQQLQQMLAAVAECPKVTVARVNGAALGGGAGLVAACDVAIAADNAVFGFTEARLGLAPAVIAPYVVQKIGTGQARALFVTGRKFSAAEAYEMGLVQQVAEPQGLDAAVHHTADDALRCGPQAVAVSKQLLQSISGLTPAEAAEITVETIAALRVSPEGQEGIHAFLGKRPPGWTL